MARDASASTSKTRCAPRFRRDRGEHTRRPRASRRVMLEPLEARHLLANWSGDLPDGTLWSDAEVHVIVGDVRVPAEATLTIAPGAVVKFQSALKLTVDGSLLAEGAIEAPILFTSYQDDTGRDGILGTADDQDTNANGPSTGAAGQWGLLQFLAGSGTSRLEHVDVRYGGAFVAGQMVVDGGDVTVSQARISASFTAGLRINNAGPQLSQVSFTDNLGPAIAMGLGSHPTLARLAFENNRVNGAQVDGGTIAGDVAWDNPDIVYVLGNDVTVAPGTTLTVGPGQVVKSEYRSLWVAGTLQAEGTADMPIVFTSLRDDTVGGDTNNDGSATRPEPGQWPGLTFAAGSIGSQLEHVELHYGSYLKPATVVVQGGELTMSDSLVHGSAGAGLRLENYHGTLSNLTLRNSAQAAIAMDLSSDPTIRGGTLLHNRVNGVRLDGGSINADAVWDDPDVVYVLGGNLNVSAGTLRVAPGQIVKSEYQGVEVAGTLLADGTADRPIVFTSFRDDTVGGDTNNDGSATQPEPGQWPGLTFTSDSVGSRLEHVELHYGSYLKPATIFVQGGELTMSDSLVRGSAGSGLRLENYDGALTNLTLQDNAQAAIAIDLASNPAIRGGTLLHNRVNGVQLDGGTIAAEMVWDDPDVVYVLGGNLNVAAGTLRVAPGQIVKSEYQGLQVSGTLLAEGTADRPIVFTSLRDDTVGGDTNNDAKATQPGPWQWPGITFASASRGSRLEHVELRNGGYLLPATVLVQGGELTMQDSLIRRSASAGLRVENGQPVLQRIDLLDNVGPALTMNLASNPQLAEITMAGNGRNGLQLDAGVLAGDAFWDDADVPYFVPGDVTVPPGVTLHVGAGQVVKSDGWAVRVDGTLRADGGVDAPIVFTSGRDDSVGGDTNGDGAASVGGPGQWTGLVFSATSRDNRLQHADVRYGGFITPGMVYVDGADVTIQESVLQEASSAGVYAINASNVSIRDSLLVHNAIVGLHARGPARASVINSTIDGSERGIRAEGAAGLELVNDLITFHSWAGVQVDNPDVAELSVTFSDVYNPTSLNYRGIADLTGTNGNISADPEYFARTNGQFQLRSGSPAIDRGTSHGAGPTDYLGQPRFDDPHVANLGGGDLPYYDMGALERQEISTSSLDLATTLVSVPAGGLQGAPLPVTWQVTNLGTETVSGVWQDSLYLSADGVWTPDDVLLGAVTSSHLLGPGQAYWADAEVRLPGVVPGKYYLLVRADAGNAVFEALHELNNVGVSPTMLSVDLPELTFNIPSFGQLEHSGAALLYRIDLPAGADVAFELNGPSGAVNELYIRHGDVPSRQMFDQRGVRPGSADQLVSFGGSRAGTYYLLVHAAQLSQPETFSLTARQTGFQVASVQPAQAGRGIVTLAISGAQFDAGATVSMVAVDGSVIDAEHVYFTDSGLIHATVDLTGAALGNADLRVSRGDGSNQTLVDAVEVITGQPGRLILNLISPDRVRVGRNYDVLVEYANEGDTDVPAPVMRLQGTGVAQFSLRPDRADAMDYLHLVGAAPIGPAGILPPGIRSTIVVHARIDAAGPDNLQLLLAGYDDSLLNWNDIEPLIRPTDLPSEIWQPLFAELQDNLGVRWREFADQLADAVTLLPASRGSQFALADVFQVEIERAWAEATSSVSGRLRHEESRVPLPNVELRLVDAAQERLVGTVSWTDGTFLIPDVPPGTYDVELEGYVSTTGQLTVAEGGLTDVELRVLPVGEIRGTVTLAPQGMPLREVLVTAFSGENQVRSVTTDDQGRFVIGSLPAGLYEVQAARAAFTSDVATGIVLEAGDEVAHVALQLQSAGTIRGIVLGPDGPLAGATVAVVTDEGTGWSATTSENGTYAIDRLAAGVYLVQAAATGLTPATVLNVALSDGGAVDGIDFQLDVAGSLEGTLRRVDGTPVAAEFVDVSSATAIYSVQTDEQGSFRLADLQPGTYVIQSLAVYSMSAVTEATVAAGDPTTVNLMTDDFGVVNGVVTRSAGGQPIGRVTVEGRRSDGGLVTAVTDDEGRYELTGMDRGVWQIALGDEWSVGIAPQMVALDHGQTTGRADFTIDIAATFAGTAYAADGATPLAEVPVALVRGEHVVLTALTDASGRYSFVVLAEGTYQIEGASESWSFPVRRNIVAAGGSYLSGLDLVAGVSVVHGRVTDQVTGLPVADAAVFVAHDDPDRHFPAARTVRTDTAGVFAMGDLVPGNYRVLAAAPGYALDDSSATVSASPTTVDLTLEPEGRVRGIVTGTDSGPPMVDATVELWSESESRMRYVTSSDLVGNFELPGIPAGAYQLVVRSAAREAVTKVVAVAAGGESIVQVEMRPAATWITGVVHDGDRPLPGVNVFASDSQGRLMANAMSGIDGSYRLEGLPPGSYHVTAGGLGYQSNEQGVFVEDEQGIAVADFALEPRATIDPEDPPGGASSSQEPVWLSEIMAAPEVSIIALIRDRYSALLSQATLDQLLRCGGKLEDVAAELTTLERMAWHWNVVDLLLGIYGGDGPRTVTELQREVETEFRSPRAASTMGYLLYQSFGGLTIDPAEGAVAQFSLMSVQLLRSRVASQLEALVTAFRGGDIGTMRRVIPQLQETLSSSTLGPGAFSELRKKLDRLKASTDIWLALAGVHEEFNARALRAGKLLLRAEKCLETAKNRPVTPAGTASENNCPADGNFRAAADCPEPGAPITSEVDSATTTAAQPVDPNEKLGNASAGAADFVRWEPLDYAIQFENDPNLGATVPAQEVFITDVLDDDLDLAMFEFVGFGFNNRDYLVPPGLMYYEQTIDLRPEEIDLLVTVMLDVDAATRILSAAFRSLDPLTRLLPDAVDAGFLPVNDKLLHNGEGYLRYRVRPQTNAESGTEIVNQAAIVFDVHAPVWTPEIRHTLDMAAPTSQVTALPAVTNRAEFSVQWSGEDEPGGAGIAHYRIYASVDGGPYYLWYPDTVETEATFGGASGHTYRFFSTAVDRVGHVESPPDTADASTTVSVSWQNPRDRLDVNADGHVYPLDVLIVINHLNAHPADPSLPEPPAVPPPYYDVSGDNCVTPLDALIVINYLNQVGAGEGETPGAVVRPSPRAAAGLLDGPDGQLRAWGRVQSVRRTASMPDASSRLPKHRRSGRESVCGLPAWQVGLERFEASGTAQREPRGLAGADQGDAAEWESTELEEAIDLLAAERAGGKVVAVLRR